LRENISGWVKCFSGNLLSRKVVGKTRARLKNSNYQKRRGVKHLNTSFARFAWLAILLIMAQIVPAQIGAGTKPIYSIEFKPGTTTTVVEGTVSTPKTVGPDMTNEGSEKYSLSVMAGQHVTIQIYSSNHQAMFTIIKPSPAGSRNEVVEKAGGVKRWSGTLAMNGNYRITVFTREEEAVSRFKLRVTLR
jgi:hypothetical protein